MSLRVLGSDKPCAKCGEIPTLGVYAGSYYWWCHKCNKEVTSE